MKPRETIQQTLTRLAPGVVPIEHEAGRFAVQSHTRSGWKYTVDITEFGSNSSCTCDKFLRYGLRTKLARGELCGRATTCSHIRAVNYYLSIVTKHNCRVLLERGDRKFVEMMMSPLPEIKK